MINAHYIYIYIIYLAVLGLIALACCGEGGYFL